MAPQLVIILPLLESSQKWTLTTAPWDCLPVGSSFRGLPDLGSLSEHFLRPGKSYRLYQRAKYKGEMWKREIHGSPT